MRPSRRFLRDVRYRVCVPRDFLRVYCHRWSINERR